ncbi:hypothetical protein NDI56_15235 [Haloarcula sp. S1CR25-12]|uniref:Cytochrome oxidase subunit II copper A binding domain-containing protein n=1 Tax=Haloarcula saliterrae TaxID=2950534 RepID=A0ABU2FES2_9EURY|nr:hypothetical protein [Haloarcula sp. S1CR25-12]MDS0260760.1 hypothetical protein [Haloarcula sp. S1CR25-12]
MTEPGSYQLYCAEFCGTDYPRMRATVPVVPPDECRERLAAIDDGAAAPSEPRDTTADQSAQPAGRARTRSRKLTLFQ